VKPFVPAVIALVVGIVLGAWQPRGELLSLRQELDEERAAARRPCRADATDGVRSLLRAPETLGVRAAKPGGDAPAVEPAVDGPLEATDAGEEPGQDAPAGGAPFQDIEEARDAMHAALDARRAQAMAALVEQGDLEDDEIEAVNAAMDRMNQELEVAVGAFVDDALADKQVDRRDVMEFAADALDIVLAADDSVRLALPADLYDDIDPTAVDPLSYVSGDTLDALLLLEGVENAAFDQ
jgi:HAMP domain-containing protein